MKDRNSQEASRGLKPESIMNPGRKQFLPGEIFETQLHQGSLESLLKGSGLDIGSSLERKQFPDRLYPLTWPKSFKEISDRVTLQPRL